MRRKIIPTSSIDRFNAVLGIVSAVYIFISFSNADYGSTAFFVFGTIITLTLSYIFQDTPIDGAQLDEYEKVIDSIKSINAQLGDLGEFLKKEQERVIDTETTLKELHKEKAQLEPVVSTQKETVEAILRAHSHSTAKHAWKERVYGFTFGVVASLTASYVFEYFSR